ncbi:MAG: hypothetical protein M3373_12805 [Gemmatimonadota bacterium]|nr:hypothetical protein [Gemmatimonadota bacterium]
MALREFVGLWWLPEAPKRTLAGTLKVEEDGKSLLFIVGSFRELNEAQNRSPSLPIVLGAASGKRITLIDALETGSSIDFPGTTTTRISPTVTLLGAHAPPSREVTFLKATATYQNLHAWTGLSGFQQQFEDNDAGYLRSVTLRYEFPPTNDARIGGALFRLLRSVETVGRPFEPITLRETVHVEVSVKQPVSLTVLLDTHLRPFQDLLALAIGEAVPLLTLRGVLAGPEESHSPNQPLEIVFETGRPSGEGRVRLPDEMLFTFADIQPRFESALGRWLDRHEALAPVMNLYFATIFHQRMYLEQRFLALAQAAESYHRRTSQSTIVDAEAFRSLRAGLCAVVDEQQLDAEARKMLKSKFNYLNEIPLKERLRELVAAEGALTSLLIPDAAAFARLVGDTRNFLTHFDPLLDGKAAQGKGLFLLSEQLRFLIELIFLRELGFTLEERDVLVRKHERYQQRRQFLLAD